MGTIRREEPRGMLFFGLLAASAQLLETARNRLARDFSAVVTSSSVIPFDQTDYYQLEMGEHLLRQWVSLHLPIRLDELVATKHHSNSLERLYANERGRQVNIDPGYLTLSKVVLATTKDHAHRLYVGRGIYEEVTLSYRKQGGFEPMPWTYPD